MNTTVLPATSAPALMPARERHWEIPRRDHRPHAVRSQNAQRLLSLARRFERVDKTFVLFHLRTVVANQFRRLVYFGERFGAILADLERHPRRQLKAAFDDQVRGAAQNRDAVAIVQRAPRVEHAARLNRVARVFARPFREMTDDDARATGLACANSPADEPRATPLTKFVKCLPSCPRTLATAASYALSSSGVTASVA